MNKNFAHALNITILKVVRALLFHYLLKKQLLKGEHVLDQPETVVFLVAFHVI